MAEIGAETGEPVAVTNLGPIEARKRMIFGAVMLVVALALTTALLFLGVRGPWLLVLFIPFWLGSLGVLQGREST